MQSWRGIGKPASLPNIASALDFSTATAGISDITGQAACLSAASTVSKVTNVSAVVPNFTETATDTSNITTSNPCMPNMVAAANIPHGGPTATARHSLTAATTANPPETFAVRKYSTVAATTGNFSNAANHATSTKTNTDHFQRFLESATNHA